MEELNPYYLERERKNEEFVKCFAWLVVILFILAAIFSVAEAMTKRQARGVSMRVTAYCPCAKCCGKYADGVTANGHRIRPGEWFAAADKSLPFGTMIAIPGYNDGRPVPVWDRGGAIKGDRLDVFFPTHKEALQWGVKQVEVSIINRKS